MQVCIYNIIKHVIFIKTLFFRILNDFLDLMKVTPRKVKIFRIIRKFLGGLPVLCKFKAGL